MDRPRFSIIVPAYKAHPFVPSMLRSLQRQTLQDFEVIVCSDDATAYPTGPKGRLVFSGGVGTGAANARNVATEHSRGDFIVMLDADDELEPNYLEAAAERLHGSDGACLTPTVVFDGENVVRRVDLQDRMDLEDFAWELASLHVVAHRDVHEPWVHTFGEDVLRDATLIARNGGSVRTTGSAYRARSHAGQMTANVRSEASIREDYRRCAAIATEESVAEVFRIRESANRVFERFRGPDRWYEFWSRMRAGSQGLVA